MVRRLRRFRFRLLPSAHQRSRIRVPARRDIPEWIAEAARCPIIRSNPA
jgi:hypothetical protein